MSGFPVVLDTCIVSYSMKGGPIAKTYAPHLHDRLLAISFITVGELYYGAEKADWSEQKRRNLETTLENFVVIPYDHEIALCYGRIVAEREQPGRPIGFNDAWIAACAVRHGLPLVTHNTRDFKGISSLKIITENKNDT